MTITLVTNEYSTEGGGLSFSCQAFECLLKEMGHEVSIIRSTVPCDRVVSSEYRPTLGSEIAMEEKLKTDCNSIIAETLVIGFGGGFNGYYSALLASKTNCKYWIMFRGSDANISKWDINQTIYNQYALAKASEVIALSDEIAQNIRFLLTQKKYIHVIPNFGKRLFHRIRTISKNDMIIGAGAFHLNEKKGVSRLLEVVSIFNKKYFPQHVCLELVGEVDFDVMAQYDNILRKLNIYDDVVFIGKLDRMTFRKRQSTWDVYVQASVCEGMGNSVVDAMSLGTPVMLSNTGFVAETAKVRFPQILFSSFESEMMADELYNLVNISDVESQYENLYSDFFSIISYENCYIQWEALLKKTQHNPKFLSRPSSILSITLHDVNGSKHDNITTPVEVFSKFVDNIYKHGYGLCSMNSYIQKSGEERERWIVCTFDDGYVGLLHNAMPILKRYGFTASVYVCIEYLGKTNDWNYKDKTKRHHLNIDELKELQKEGWEIGSHGVTHQSLLRLDDNEIEFQLQESKNVLEKHFGKIHTYAYPYGDFSPFIESVVKKYYDYAFLLTQGGVFLSVDSHRIHRYYISEINQIINEK